MVAHQLVFETHSFRFDHLAPGAYTVAAPYLGGNMAADGAVIAARGHVNTVILRNSCK